LHKTVPVKGRISIAVSAAALPIGADSKGLIAPQARTGRSAGQDRSARRQGTDLLYSTGSRPSARTWPASSQPAAGSYVTYVSNRSQPRCKRSHRALQPISSRSENADRKYGNRRRKPQPAIEVASRNCGGTRKCTLANTDLRASRFSGGRYRAEPEGAIANRSSSAASQSGTRAVSSVPLPPCPTDSTSPSSWTRETRSPRL
jgi:hypothetical protein